MFLSQNISDLQFVEGIYPLCCFEGNLILAKSPLELRV